MAGPFLMNLPRQNSTQHPEQFPWHEYMKITYFGEMREKINPEISNWELKYEMEN